MAESNPHDPTEVDLQIVEDEALGHPAKRRAHQGVADMTARIAQLNDEKKKLLATMADAEGKDYGTRQPDLWKSIDQLNAQLKEAGERLAEYELQVQSHN